MGFVKDKQIQVHKYTPSESEEKEIIGDLPEPVQVESKMEIEAPEIQLPSDRSKPFVKDKFVFITNLCHTVSVTYLLKFLTFCGNIVSYAIDRDTQTALVEFDRISCCEVAVLSSGVRLGEQDINIQSYHPERDGTSLYHKLYLGDTVKKEQEVPPPVQTKEMLEVELKERVICVPLTRIQRHYYKDLVTDLLEEDYPFTEIIKRLCKCCNHPFTIPQQSFISELTEEKKMEAIVHWSGKFKYLDSLLEAIRQRKENVLVCSSDMRNIEVLQHHSKARYDQHITNIKECKLIDSVGT